MKNPKSRKKISSKSISSKFCKTSSQWATPCTNLILTEPDLAAPHTLTENPNLEKIILIQNISSKFDKTSSQWATPCTNLILTKSDLAAHDTVNENPNPDFKISSKSIETSHPILQN
jgi:hypothetical protein